jgi:CCR4-NOT transcription complex subunit 9
MLCAASYGKFNMVRWISTNKSNHIYRLSDNARAREALRQCLPEPLRDATFSNVLRDDAATKRCLAQLLINLSDSSAEGSMPGFAH